MCFATHRSIKSFCYSVRFLNTLGRPNLQWEQNMPGTAVAELYSYRFGLIIGGTS